MAKTTGVWGIDIGRAAIKALRCRLDGDAIVADGFDYIEYPKLLSQPDADPNQLIKEALEQFLSRNSVKGDRVAIGVSGESGLARYFKPPPVDVKKIADIVKYEAKQQIPFALEDVIWDYQRMPGGQEVDGFALDTEIGLFAMKREQVTKALAPYVQSMIEVDYIQLAPISIYNYVAYDICKESNPDEEYNPESPPPSIAVLSIGTDTSDLVVTNGFRLWQRNIPLGGSHFTKQLSKDLKLTFAKAEHLKRNPKQADDPKAIFQAMRPVFGDLVAEVQRSIRHFQNLDRKATITKVVLLGNTSKLPGLQQYLGKHLGYDVHEVESFNRLSGAEVVTSPSFKDNLPAFGPCYGLCLQGLGRSKVSTNLLPREIYTQRMIKAKKPWALAGVSALVLGCALNFIFHYRVWEQVNLDHEADQVKWSQALDKATSVSTLSSGLKSADEAQLKQLDFLKQVGQEVVGTADRRVLWLELTKAINAALPPTDANLAPNQIPDAKALDFQKRKDLKIDYVESQFFPDLKLWFTDEVKRKYIEANPAVLAEAAAAGGSGAPTAPAPPVAQAPPAMDPAMGGAMVPPDMAGGYGGGTTGSAANLGIDVSAVNVTPPEGPGWIIELRGYHFYNDPSDQRNTGAAHVRNTLINFLENGSIELPLGPGLGTDRFTMDELGIGYVINAWDVPINNNFQLPNPNYVAPAGGEGGAFGGFDPMGGAMGVPMGRTPAAKDAKKAATDNPQFFKVRRYDFIVQFVWQEKPLAKRLEERVAKAKAAAEAAAAAAANPAPTPEAAPAPGVNPAAPVPGAPAPGAVVPGAVAPGAPAPATPAPGVPAPAAPMANPAAPMAPAAATPAPVPAAPGGNVPATPAAPPAAAPAAAVPPADADLPANTPAPAPQGGAPAIPMGAAPVPATPAAPPAATPAPVAPATPAPATPPAGLPDSID